MLDLSKMPLNEHFTQMVQVERDPLWLMFFPSEMLRDAMVIAKLRMDSDLVMDEDDGILAFGTLGTDLDTRRVIRHVVALVLQLHMRSGGLAVPPMIAAEAAPVGRQADLLARALLATLYSRSAEVLQMVIEARRLDQLMLTSGAALTEPH